MEPGIGQAGERREEGLGIGGEPVDERLHRRSSVAVEGVPTEAEPLPHRHPCRFVAGGGPPGQEQDAAAQVGPRKWRRHLRMPFVTVQRGERPEDAVDSLLVDRGLPA